MDQISFSFLLLGTYAGFEGVDPLHTLLGGSNKYT